MIFYKSSPFRSLRERTVGKLLLNEFSEGLRLLTQGACFLDASYACGENFWPQLCVTQPLGANITKALYSTFA